jgi:hypothetical protein
LIKHCLTGGLFSSFRAETLTDFPFDPARTNRLVDSAQNSWVVLVSHDRTLRIAELRVTELLKIGCTLFDRERCGGCACSPAGEGGC